MLVVFIESAILQITVVIIHFNLANFL